MMNRVTRNLQSHKRLVATNWIVCLVCMVLWTSPAFGEDASLSLSSDQGVTGETVTLSLTLGYPGAAVAAGFNLDIYYDKAVLELVLDGDGNPEVAAGQVLINAGKEMSVNEFTHPYFGVLRMLVAGFGEPGEPPTLIQASEAAATIDFRIKWTAAGGPTAVELTEVIVTDAAGVALGEVLVNEGELDGVIDVTVGDFDLDTVLDNEDNCPINDNGPGGGTCTLGTVGEPCMADANCGTGGLCSMDQEDSYPPLGGNGYGDACECEGNFDADVDCDGEDASVFKIDFGRNKYVEPCGGPIGLCDGNFDCDLDVDGEDAAIFKKDFGRNKYYDPCPGSAKNTWCE